jgi:ABC-type uncharacterized transport system auxiliary subunit
VIARSLKSLLLLCLALSVLGCAGSIRPQTTRPELHRLQPADQARSCRHAFDRSLRIWDFSTAEPFNRNQMAVLNSNGTMVFSREHQWVDLPGVMIAQALQRDLSRSGLFTTVVRGMPEVGTAYELSGRLLAFGCQRGRDGDRAVLRVQVRLHQQSKPEEPVFDQTYGYRSPSSARLSSSDFVDAMNGLAARFFSRLRQDLCRLAGAEG